MQLNWYQRGCIVPPGPARFKQDVGPYILFPEVILLSGKKSKKCSRRRNSLLAPLLEAKFELSLKAFKSYPIVKNKQK